MSLCENCNNKEAAQGHTLCIWCYGGEKLNEIIPLKIHIKERDRYYKRGEGTVNLHKARIKELEKKLNEAHTLLSTVDQAGGKKHHRFAVGVPQDDIEVSFLTASFMKKVKAWLNGSPTQEGDKE